MTFKKTHIAIFLMQANICILGQVLTVLNKTFFIFAHCKFINPAYGWCKKKKQQKKVIKID